jgi:deoxyribonuclease IV
MPAAAPAARIGAHVSVAGGLSRALARADAIGAEAIQVFVANPRAWASPEPDPQGDEAFRVACRSRGLSVFVHAPYLVNFGSPDERTLAASRRALAFSLRRGAAIGARGVVLHAGWSVGAPYEQALRQVREHLLPALDSVSDRTSTRRTPLALIEPTAGGAGALASDAASLADYLEALGHDERVGVCLDTCHMHAAGHDLSSPDRFARALRVFARAAGRGRVRLVHVNDSQDPVGSRRDRHAALGQGTIGRETFGALFTVPGIRGVPLVVEAAEADQAPDIATLKSLRAAAPPTVRRP